MNEGNPNHQRVLPNIGVPYTPHAVRVMILGSGELGKELAIELSRLGIEVTAVDRYANAPAMHIAHHSYVIDMLSGDELRQTIKKVNPHFIVPEVEAIATNVLSEFESCGVTVVPNAKAVCLTMDREGIRRLAAEELYVATTKYAFANSADELLSAASSIGYPCFVKPLMSSSGKGQSICKSGADVANSWTVSQSGARSAANRVIVERAVEFESEITLLTIRSREGTFFCDPIGHRQKGGDYVESWQPHKMSDEQLETAQTIAKKVTDALGGYGLFGVELFLLQDGTVLFNEVSPRPHDTGMVTMATQNYSQFSLHARAFLGLPVQKLQRHSFGASAALKSTESFDNPEVVGIEKTLALGADIRIFGKPIATPGRRLGVVLFSHDNSEEQALEMAMSARELITIVNSGSKQ